jgi:hypothetical protein
MSDWRNAEDLLKAIQRDLTQEQPDWAGALLGTEQVQLLVPDFPLFQKIEPGESLPKTDIRVSLLRTDLDHLELGIAKTDLNLAQVSVSSALRSVQELGRKEKT